MYWFNIKALKDDLKKGKLTQKDQMLYLLATFTFATIMQELATYFPIEDSATYLDYIDSLLYLVILISGIIYSYIVNGANSGKNFMQRYISISFVLGVRYTIIFIGFSSLIVLALIILNIYGYEDLEPYIEVIFTFLANMFYLIYTYFVVKNIHEIATKE